MTGTGGCLSGWENPILDRQPLPMRTSPEYDLIRQARAAFRKRFQTEPSVLQLSYITGMSEEEVKLVIMEYADRYLATMKRMAKERAEARRGRHGIGRQDRGDSAEAGGPER